MLKLFESTPGTLVLSLRSGGPIGQIVGPIINPNNLYIEGWYVEDNRSKQVLILLSNDIRDVIRQGFAVDDHEVLTEASDLVRLKKIIKMDFNLIGLRVNSEGGTKYGKVNDYAFETNNMFIQKIYSSQSLVKNLSSGSLSIDRSQIIEVTNRRIVIEDPTEKTLSPAQSAGLAS